MTREDLFACILTGDTWTYEVAKFVADKSGWVEPIADHKDRFEVIKPFMMRGRQVNVGDILMLAPIPGTNTNVMIYTNDTQDIWF
jgi:hypothetical protein